MIKSDINPMQRALLVLALTAGQALPVLAAPVTMACQYVNSNAPSHPFTQVDQFVYDLDAGSAELRVANTMGTDTPVNWIFITKKDMLNDDQFTVKRTGQGVVGAGIYGSAPHSFDLYDSGLLVWSFIWFSAEPTWLAWRCQN